MSDDSIEREARKAGGGSPDLPRRRTGETLPPAEEVLSQGDQYRIVTDLVAGPNLRWRDNLFQAVFILVALLVSSGVGAVFWGVDGAVIGGAGGLIGGLFLSGAVLGLYRAYSHAKGRHK